MNKHLPALAVLGLATFSLLAQEKATTQSGRKVILFTDGTWKFETRNESLVKQSGEFNRPASATEKFKFKPSKFNIYYNPTIWKAGPQTNPTRYQFQHKDGDGYALIIAERMQVSLDVLKNLALTNAKGAAPDAKITFEENRKVNGVDVLTMQIKGTIQGIPFTYFGYYYAGKEGSIQVLTYTADNLFDEFKGDFSDFLNGFGIEP